MTTAKKTTKATKPAAPPATTPNTEHVPKLLTEADAAADLAGTPRPDNPTTSDAPRGVLSLEEARALPVIELADKGSGACSPFEANEPRQVEQFLGADERVMRVVWLDGVLAAQPVEA
jgi:hypothetical protein